MGSSSSKQRQFPVDATMHSKSSAKTSAPYDPRPHIKNPDKKAAVPATAQAEDVLAALRRFDTVIVVDDSGSMSQGNRWKQARLALGTLAAVASKYDTDGIEIHFLNSKVSRRNVTDMAAVKSLFASVQPYGRTPLGKKMKSLLDAYFVQLDRDNWQTKPVNYIVITDGIPTDGSATENAIVEAATKLDQHQARVAQIGIQFVQIGTEKGATIYLQKLDDDLSANKNVRDIVDTTTGEGLKLDLVKILIGAINRRVDNKGSKVLVSED